HRLAAGGVHCVIGDVVVDYAQRRLDHLAAVIDLGDDPVGTVALIGGDGDAGPPDGGVMAGEVGQYIAAAVLVLAGDDDAGLVGVLARTRCRVDGDYDAHQVAHHEPHRRPRRLDERSAPQRTRHIVEQLAVQFLAAEPGALVFFDDLLEERAGEVGAIFVARAAGHDAGRVAHQIADQFRGPWRRRYHGTRGGPGPDAEHQHAPGLGIAPGAELVAPCCIVLRSAQTFRLIGRIGRRDRTVGPRQPALAGLVNRALWIGRNGQNAGFALDHNIARVGCG